MALVKRPHTDSCTVARLLHDTNVRHDCNTHCQLLRLATGLACAGSLANGQFAARWAMWALNIDGINELLRCSVDCIMSAYVDINNQEAIGHLSDWQPLLSVQTKYVQHGIP